MKLLKRDLQSILAISTALIAGIVMILVIRQVYQTSDQIKALKTIQENQAKAVVQLQNAVRDLKVEDERQTNIIICMLQVPQPERTTDLENNCRKQSEATIPAATSSQPTQQQTTTQPQAASHPASKSNAVARAFDSLARKITKLVGLE